MIKIETTEQEQHGVRLGPNLLLPVLRLSAGKNQSDRVSVFRAFLQPDASLFSVRRVTPNAATPLLFQPIIENTEVIRCRRPRSLYGRARIKIECSERSNYLRGSKPLVFSSVLGMMTSNTHFLYAVIISASAAIGRSGAHSGDWHMMCSRRARFSSASSSRTSARNSS